MSRNKLDPMDVLLGQQIRKIRRDKGLLSKYVTEKMGKKGTYLTFREAGQVPVSVKDLTKLCTILNVSADDILGIFLPQNLNDNEN